MIGCARAAESASGVAASRPRQRRRSITVRDMILRLRPNFMARPYAGQHTPMHHAPASHEAFQMRKTSAFAAAVHIPAKPTLVRRQGHVPTHEPSAHPESAGTECALVGSVPTPPAAHGIG